MNHLGASTATPPRRPAAIALSADARWQAALDHGDYVDAGISISFVKLVEGGFIFPPDPLGLLGRVEGVFYRIALSEVAYGESRRNPAFQGGEGVTPCRIR